MPPTSSATVGAEHIGRWLNRLNAQLDYLATADGVWPGLTAEILSSTDSSNQRLVEALRAAGPAGAGVEMQPRLCVALEQTAGRGRLGRPWQSRPGASLTFSLALPVHRADVSGLSLAVGLAVAQALDPGGERLGLKWPNDVWLREGPGQGRKLAGVLIEGLMLAGQRWVVIGIGINILPPGDDAALPQAVACWQEIQAESESAQAPQALEAILDALAGIWPRFEAGGFACLAEEFARRDVLLGLPVHTNDATAAEGIAEGVGPDGALLLRVNGQLRSVVSGEISVRPAGMALPKR